ncbi:MAG: carboxypeptidase-like regulatory domain-containing protein [Bacteroidetes bacterium]|nr:carboxypeptidase-like regulatory domain-containing protein [Bacteroidota bacterium]
MQAWIYRNQINFNYLSVLTPVWKGHKDSTKSMPPLPIGNYVWISAEGYQLKAFTDIVSQISFGNLTNGRHRLLTVFNQSGELTFGRAFLDNKPLKWDAVNKGYLLPDKKDFSDKLLRIEAPGDTLFSWLSREEDDRSYHNRQQAGFPVRQLKNIGFSIKRLFTGNQRYYRDGQRRRKKALVGFYVFNKPIYKSADTLRFKAWITDRRGYPDTKPKDFFISYTYKNSYKNISLGTIKPVSPGSFVTEWSLPDSLPMNTRYTVTLSGPSEFASLSGSFTMEEYELPNITRFSMQLEKNRWLRKESLKIALTAQDASGLYITDGKVELTAVTLQISQIHNDAVFIPDTLWRKTISLSTDKATEVYIPANELPDADIKFNLTAVLRNSTNEIKEASEVLEQFSKERRLEMKRNGDRLYIAYLENDRSLARRVALTIWGETVDIDSSFMLPASIALHPMATNYDAKALDEKGNELATASLQLEVEELSPRLEPLTLPGDSIGFRVINPASLPVWVSLMKGKQKIWTQLTTEPEYKWRETVSRRNMYQASIHFIYDGEEKTAQVNLGVLYNVLQVQAKISASNSPGAKDSLLVQVNDYKGRPVPGANITATAQNLQLKDKFRSPVLPLRMTYRHQKQFFAPGPIETDDALVKQDSIAALFPLLATQLGCDTLFFYQRLFSPDPLFIAKTPIASNLPEIALHVYENGKPQTVYITYLNKLPIDIYWQDAYKPESYSLHPSYAKIAMRLSDRLIEIDSLYMQPYYKHDIFINADSTQRHKNIKIVAQPDTLSNLEKQELEKYFLPIALNHEAEFAWLWGASDYWQLPKGPGASIIGPIRAFDSVHIFNRGLIDMKFSFEPGYQYRLTQNMARLEKQRLLEDRTHLALAPKKWILGDTIAQLDLPPVYRKETGHRTFVLTNRAYQTSPEQGMLQLFMQTDSIIAYTVLLPDTGILQPIILSGKQTSIHSLLPGTYKVLLIDRNDHAWVSNTVLVSAHGINAYKLFPTRFSGSNIEAANLFYAQQQQISQELANMLKNRQTEPVSTNSPNRVLVPGSASISGAVRDAVSGDPIVGALIQIKGTTRSTSTDAAGAFYFDNLPSEDFVLIASLVGYQLREVKIRTISDQEMQTSFRLQISENGLNEVVVVGYGLANKRSLTSSSTSIVANELQGRAAGIMLQDIAGAVSEISIRGASTLNDSNPLYVIDGSPVDMLPPGMDTSTLSVEILKGSAAKAIYGERGRNGVILISTGKNSSPIVRTIFRDYAYWQPNTITDQFGKAVIPVRYPENLTSWQHMVFAAGKKGKYGTSVGVTKIFKPVQALLQVPAFLLSSDSIALIGKVVNYSSEEKQLTGQFKWITDQASDAYVMPGASATMYMKLKAPRTYDTVRLSFSVVNKGNIVDGEERSIPVLPVGSIETTGKFFVLDKDSSFQFSPAYNDQPVTLYAENKLIDLLEKELEQLRKYPQACMEQTANKMWGLLMMRQIKLKTKQPFTYQKTISKLQQRLFENQLYNGGWSWWGSGNANIYITTKVLQALRQADSSVVTKKAIRDGNIYLQNVLPTLLRAEKLEALLCLSESKHLYPYQFALDSIPFDSLSIHQQWQFVRIKQNIGLPYEKELLSLWKKKTENYTGGIHWGTDTWRWQNNITATMVIAMKVIRNNPDYYKYLPQLKQYLLSEKKSLYYQNTVEQAEVTNALLEDALDNQFDSRIPSTLTVNGSIINHFPQQLKLEPASTITLSKKGGGLIFVGFNQEKWETNPPKRDSLFSVNTVLLQGVRLLKENEPWISKAGERIELRAEITAKKEADYVEIEIPIPAGCSYDNKNYDSFHEFREYRKDKLLIYVEKMAAGKHVFNIPLQTRFSGSFTINPTRVSLMYFPVFNGNNRLQTIKIE